MRVSTFASERSYNEIWIDGSAGPDTESFAVVDPILGYEWATLFVGGNEIFRRFEAQLLNQPGAKHVIGPNPVAASESILFLWSKTRRTSRRTVTRFTRAGLKL